MILLWVKLIEAFAALKGLLPRLEIMVALRKSARLAT